MAEFDVAVAVLLVVLDVVAVVVVGEIVERGKGK